MSNDNQFNGVAPADLVEQQLARIQNSPHFSNSRRYPSFLNYVVQKTLTGHQEDLKERTIGVEAFGRPPGYDLNADPVVRVTAGEVRKRLAQYYYEPEHLEELRIELHPGSYIPEFKLAPGQANSIHTNKAHSPARTDNLAPPKPPVQPVEIPQTGSSPASAATSKRGRNLVVALAGGLTFMASVLFAGWYLHPSAVKVFWQPVLANRQPVLILVGSVLALSNAPVAGVGDASVGGHPLHSDPVALSDTIALAKLQEVLASNNKAVSVESSAQTSFSNLQKGPVVLISAFNNPWTMRLTNPLRFHFTRPSVNTFEIDDRRDQSRKWSVYTLAPLNKVNDDYGLIARFHDPVTEQIVVVAAGIGESGTIAAAEALSDERSLQDLKQSGQMPSEKGNFEAVVWVTMIDGKPGPPKVVAVTRW